MSRLDRFIVAALAAGVWALVLALMFGPTEAPARDTLSEGDVRSIVQKHCTVYGDVYIHNMPYGEINGGYISC